MAYQVLARKYRPQRFSDVVGQDHVTRTLLNALAQDRIAHGYIFSGHRGIGKTTIARILAMALNCRNSIGSQLRPTPEPCEVCDSCTEIRAGNAVNVIEIDAATNRGIDEIRELRDAARYAPSRDRYKIYILDEAHQITDAAFNALLKTLEEPPPHIIFMMATTQPEDIPQTIRSRCQHFSFHAVKLDDIVGQLSLIAKAEHILADDATLALLAEAGDGSMRDALSIMDQAIASAPVVPAEPAPQSPGGPSMTASSSWVGDKAVAPTQSPGGPSMTASSSWVGDNAVAPTQGPGGPSMTASSSWVGDNAVAPTQSPGGPSMTASPSWVGDNAVAPTQGPGGPSMTASSSWVGDNAVAPTQGPGGPSMTASSSWVGDNAVAPTQSPGGPSMTASPSWVGDNAVAPTQSPGGPSMTASPSWVGDNAVAPTQGPGGPSMTASSSWVGDNAVAPTQGPGGPSMTASPSWVGNEGRPHLEITQIRELMGSVSNVVYEQILQAVHANNSADVLAITGRLLDAGNGAPQLARQFVRYLRNTIVAKITNLSPQAEATGIAADLLQISPEERHRAARSAALFTEEELSRFLAIMLRTFDDLGYRQEQRFHLELGLLKLVHMQRLIPIEDLLSQLGAKPASTPTSTPSSNPASTPKTIPASTSTAPAPIAAPPANLAGENSVILSEVSRPHRDTQSKDPETARPVQNLQTFSTPTPVATTEGSLALADRPAPAPRPDTLTPQPLPRPHLVTTPPEAAPTPGAPSGVPGERSLLPGVEFMTASPSWVGSPAASLSADTPDLPGAPFMTASPSWVGSTEASQPEPVPDLPALQQTLAAALAAAKGQQSASEQIEDATFTLADNTLTIQTTLSKTMLPVVLNADAERILKLTLREHAPTLQLTILPGAPASTTAPRKPRTAAAGSAAELADKHPIVQQARRLFSADISNVIDLRDKD